jgi:methylglutaconyl-CoA hydratase
LAYSACKNETVKVTVKSQVATILLDRTDKANALNEAMVAELTEAFIQTEADENVRVIVLRGKGKNFCAGADINWMAEAKDFSKKENHSDAMKLAHLMSIIANTKKPVVCVLQGHVYGGAVGLAACSDIVLGDRTTTFCLSETRLGLIPAVIGPYVVQALGVRQAKRYMLLACEFNIADALEEGLVHELYDQGKADEALQATVRKLLRNGPEALQKVKEFMRDYEVDVNDKASADLIADIRVSKEAQEGMTAFLEKRLPEWAPKMKELKEAKEA